jgi:hypothetical protein
VYNVTLHGVVCGRGTGGSAKAVFVDPILSSALAKADSKTNSETSVAANFESWEVVTETSKLDVQKVAELGVACGMKSRSGRGV